MASNGNPDNLPAIPTVSNERLLMAAADPMFVFDDLAKEGIARALQAVEQRSLSPIYREDAENMPITTHGGRLLGRAWTKLHQLFDSASTHGPARNTRVRVVESDEVVPQEDRTNRRRKR